MMPDPHGSNMGRRQDDQTPRPPETPKEVRPPDPLRHKQTSLHNDGDLIGKAGGLMLEAKIRPNQKQTVKGSDNG